jgi:8-oxo-dGTP diphosphatase
MALLSNSKVSLATESQYIAEITFCPVLQLPEMSFDHQYIIDYSVKRLKYKLEYTNVAQFLLPSQFTLRELQDVYEIVI